MMKAVEQIGWFTLLFSGRPYFDLGVVDYIFKHIVLGQADPDQGDEVSKTV